MNDLDRFIYHSARAELVKLWAADPDVTGAVLVLPNGQRVDLEVPPAPDDPPP